MNKKMTVIVVTFFALLTMISAAGAGAMPKAVTGEITVSADDDGVVSVTGSSAGELGRLTQFCTDEINAKQGCGDNIEIAVQNGSYPLDKDGMRDGQLAFNFHHENGGDWLWIPRQNVRLGKNVSIVPGVQGHRFVYTGPVPK